LCFTTAIIARSAATDITLSLHSNIGCHAGVTQASNLLQSIRPRQAIRLGRRKHKFLWAPRPGQAGTF
jgi:hypothetical protein